MLKVSGSGSITTCDGITRRDFLQVGMLGALGFSLSNLAALQALGAVANGQDAGFLGKGLDPFVLNADPSRKDFRVPDLLPPQEIGEARLRRRRQLRDIVDETVRSFEASANAQLMDSSFAAAYRLMTSARARDAFDLAKEPEAV